jgi:hypothetical protein
VRAYDNSNNITAIGTAPITYERRADDIYAPTFASGLSASLVTTANGTCASAGKGICLGFTAATDNQYAGDSNVLKYKIYRKTGVLLHCIIFR